MRNASAQLFYVLHWTSVPAYRIFLGPEPPNLRNPYHSNASLYDFAVIM